MMRPAEWISPSPVTMFVNLIVWRRAYALQKKIDNLKKNVEFLKQEEKLLLEKAAKYFEIAKQHLQDNNKRCALHNLKRKLFLETSAKHYLACHMFFHNELSVHESGKNEFIRAERLRIEKKVIKALPLVFLFLLLFPLMLAFFWSS